MVGMITRDGISRFLVVATLWLATCIAAPGALAQGAALDAPVQRGAAPASPVREGSEQQSPAPQDPDRVRTLVHVLDYLAIDYPGAVQGGVVTDSLEYAEMVEFSALTDSLVHEFMREGILPADSFVPGAAADLGRLVADLAASADVASKAQEIRNELLRASGIAVAPTRWPDIAAGGRLFATYCTACHGANGAGDGPAAAALNPAPAVMNSGDRIAGIAPFQAYNTIRLGVGGTGMAAFGQLAEHEVWDLAFFVKSLAHKGSYDSVATSQALAWVSLDEVSSLDDSGLHRLLTDRGAVDPAAAVRAIRSALPPGVDGTSLDRATELLAAALAAYRAGDLSGAREAAIAAYLQGVEPVEPILAASDPEIVARLERAMMAVRSAIQSRAPADEIAILVAESNTWLDLAREKLGARNHSAWFTFWMAMSILLREALEAFLIIIALLGVIKASGQARAARWIHAGWISAVLVGFLGWLLVDLLMQMSAAHRELMEGSIAIFAVIVLLTVGFWLHDMTSVQKWKAFLSMRIKEQLSTGNLVGLGAFAFFAVFREAFESVLFLAALGLDGGENTRFALASATGTTLVLVLVLGIAAVRYSTRLPIKQLFRYASVLIVLLAFILAGKGIHSLQEAGYVSVSLVEWSFRVELLGLYATMETLAAQALVVLVVVGLYLATRRSHTKLAA